MWGVVILTEGVYGCERCGSAVTKDDALWSWTYEDQPLIERTAPLCPTCAYLEVKEHSEEVLSDVDSGEWGRWYAESMLGEWREDMAMYENNPIADVRLAGFLEQLQEWVDSLPDE